MLAVLVGYDNLHLVAILEDVRVVELIFLINIELAINLIRFTVGLILEVVAAVVVLGEHDIGNGVLALYRHAVMLAEPVFQLFNLGFRRLVAVAKLLIVEVFVVAGVVLGLMDDVVGYGLVVVDVVGIVVDYLLDVGVYGFTHIFDLTVLSRA